MDLSFHSMRYFSFKYKPEANVRWSMKESYFLLLTSDFRPLTSDL